MDNSFAPTAIENNITASVDNNSIIVPSHKTVSFSKKENTVIAKTNFSSETKKQKKIFSKLPKSPDGSFPVWAYILIALLLPPLAVGLKYGCHAAFWLCLIFTLLGFVPGLIYALVYLALQGNKVD